MPISVYCGGGDTLVFAHGYNTRFEFIRPPDDVDVIMVASRMGGRGTTGLPRIQQAA